MTAKRSPLQVSVEQEVPSSGEAPPRRVRVSATLTPAEGEEVTAEEVAATTHRLEEGLKQAVVALEGGEHALGPRADRILAELVAAYHPKTVELVDALLWDGELTPTEHEALRAEVAHGRERAPRTTTTTAPTPPTPPPPRAALAPSATPSAPATPAAAAPARAATPAPGADAGTPSPSSSTASAPRAPARTVEALVRELELKDMRDVNRARGRRVISYEEWASLKAHFERKP